MPHHHHTLWLRAVGPHGGRVCRLHEARRAVAPAGHPVVRAAPPAVWPQLPAARECCFFVMGGSRGRRWLWGTCRASSSCCVHAAALCGTPPHHLPTPHRPTAAFTLCAAPSRGTSSPPTLTTCGCWVCSPCAPVVCVCMRAHAQGPTGAAGLTGSPIHSMPVAVPLLPVPAVSPCPAANEDVSLGLWMLAANVTHFEDMRLCSPACT